jgi:hypothetical protein
VNTPALTILELVRKMRDYSRAAFNEALRCHGETDAVLLGKLTAFDVIADSVSLHDPDMTERERRELQAARHEVGRAFDHLTVRVTATPEVRRRKRAEALGLSY